MIQPEPPLRNEAEVPSPSLLVYADRLEENLRRMIALAGDASRLRPHIKTHKLPQVVARQAELGVTKVKCATIAEAEMAAQAGARDILIAMPLVGPNVARLLELMRRYPRAAFATIADDPAALTALGRAAADARMTIDVLLDLDVGMHRTGIAPGPEAGALYRRLASTAGLRAGGLHAYDGHLRQRDLPERTAAVAAAFAPVDALVNELRQAGLPVPRLVYGGTPTFPIHARSAGVECSPGTPVLWDASYAAALPEQEFLHAAVLLTRVISRPAVNRLCFDLGHKAVASEMPQPRAIFPALPDAKAIGHSEEHLLVETSRAAEFPVGTAFYAIPWHVCPTIALHDRVRVVRNGNAVEEWPVVARARRLGV
jgi:D-serine deaminase-like pyridoxal phosphate-dependent protein